MEKKIKWIGLEWRKGREIGEKSCPKIHFLTKTHKTHFQKEIRPFFGKHKAPQGYPLETARWARGTGSGPNVNEIDQIWSR